MFVRDLGECDEFLAGDRTVLREILHPGKAPLALRYSLAHATLPPGGVSLRHRLSASEVYYILEGEGVLHIDGESRKVAAGQAAYIPPRAVQHIENAGTSDLRFLCIVDPAWRPDLEDVL